MSTPGGTTKSFAQITIGLVGFLFFLELTSGVLQGYYVPLVDHLVRYLGITHADFNWFEAGQLLLSALSVPVLAKLGDLVGHKRILLISTLLTGAATWALVFTGDFWTYLIAWTFQGFYAVWLPLEVALIFDRGRRSNTGVSTTRRVAGLLVVALEVGAIAGALGGAQIFKATGQNVPLTLVAPAVMVTLAFFAILWGVPESERTTEKRSLDVRGFTFLAISLLLVMSSLTFLRLNGPETWWVWVLMAVGLLSFIPFGRLMLRTDDPAVDLRVLRRPAMWPVQVTAGLFGISVLGAQFPLAAFAATDPAVTSTGPDDPGYGLGLEDTSIIIGIYLVSLVVGAIIFSVVSRRVPPRRVLIVATALVALGYFALIPFHADIVQMLACIMIAGIGSGALVAALPAAAAAAAPPGRTGIAAGLTNTTKTIGGAFASAVFALALHTGATEGAVESSLTGYYIVWAVCGGGALVATLLLFFVPKVAFADPDPEYSEVSPSA